MKVFSAAQIRAWDQYTITHEPISSLDLMERAAKAFMYWFCARYDSSTKICICCGEGNNGGDGLAIARLLAQKEYAVQLLVVRHLATPSADFIANLTRLPTCVEPTIVQTADELPELDDYEILIDALLGTGLSRPVEGVMASLISHINQHPIKVISVDIGSGLYCDRPTPASAIVMKADQTVTFQSPKLAFFFPSNQGYVGDWTAVEIGLSQAYYEATFSPYFYTDTKAAQRLVRSRAKFSHKGTYGHALLMAGSHGKIGAAILAARACMRSGVGLLTVRTAGVGYSILQSTVPEAMVLPDPDEHFLSELPDLQAYDAIGVGPGIGQVACVRALVVALIASTARPLVLDADAINCLALERSASSSLPTQTILTPHLKEFERLVGSTALDDFERLDQARTFCENYGVTLCLKGAHTAVVCPDGSVHFNSTGNPGMATAGSGDVLTGILTALLAQGYTATEAAILGVYQHGLAGDRAAIRRGQSALIASDLIEHLGW